MFQLNVGDVLSPHELVTSSHGKQFRRYAGCPVCNLHLRSIAQRHDEVLAAGYVRLSELQGHPPQRTAGSTPRMRWGVEQVFMPTPDGNVLLRERPGRA